jgi:GT2 family glycosyltransferase
MTLAIIIVNWNVKELLRDCLASVLADIERGKALPPQLSLHHMALTCL